MTSSMTSVDSETDQILNLHLFLYQYGNSSCLWVILDKLVSPHYYQAFLIDVILHSSEDIRIEWHWPLRWFRNMRTGEFYFQSFIIQLLRSVRVLHCFHSLPPEYQIVCCLSLGFWLQYHGILVAPVAGFQGFVLWIEFISEYCVNFYILAFFSC